MSMKNNSMLKNYTQLNTIPAISGVVFAISSAVQFLGATFSLETPAYSFDPAHAMVLSLVVLVVAFASSETKNFNAYEPFEQATVALAVVLIAGNEYVTQITDLIANNSPMASYIAFGVTLAAWGVVSR